MTIRLFLNAQGEVVREIDQNRGKRTFYSPETGKSFSFPEASSGHFAYPDGVYLGAPVTGHLVGFVGQGGKVTDAGRAVIEGEVVWVEEIDGVSVPFIDLWIVDGRGSRPSEDEYLSGRCEALGGTYTP